MAQQITQQQGHGLDEMLSQRPGVGGDLATPAAPPRTMPRTSSQTSNISGISAEVRIVQGDLKAVGSLTGR